MPIGAPSGRLRRGIIGVERSFTGQQKDFSSGLIYMKARYYDPDLGQFLSPDTLVPDPGTLFDYNRYLYTRGNPMRYTDPTGHCTTLDDGSRDMENDAGCWNAADEWFATFGKGAFETDDDWQKFFAGNAAMTEDVLRAGLFNHWAPIYRESGIYHERYNPAPQMHPVTSDDQAFEKFNRKYGPDCTHKDCLTQALDAGSSGAAVVTSACLYTGQLHCAGIATFVGTVLTGWGTGRTVASAINNPTTANKVDATVAVVTAIAGSAGGAGGKGLVGVGLSTFQWGYDYLDFTK